MTRSVAPKRPQRNQPTGPDHTPRWVWVLVIALVAALAAVVSGMLADAGGATIWSAIFTAGGAFMAVFAVLLATARYLHGHD